jgi:hypothetical protein
MGVGSHIVPTKGQFAAGPVWGINASMRAMRTLFHCATLAVMCAANNAGELAVSPLFPLEMPTLSSDAWNLFSYRGVAVSGTNVVYFWNQRSGDRPDAGAESARPFTNVFVARADLSGQPIEEPPHVVAPSVHAHWQARFVPAPNGFFAVLQENVNNIYPPKTNIYFTRVSPDGASNFRPILLSTNAAAFEVSGNGRTLFYAQRDNAPNTNAITYRLINATGLIIASGQVADSFAQPDSAAKSLALTTNGEDYVLIWDTHARSSRTYLRMTRFSGRDGSNVTIPVANAPFAVSAISHSANGYLIFAYSASSASVAQFLHLREDGSEVARTNISPVYAPSCALFAENDGWTLFQAIPEKLRSFQIIPSETALTIKTNPYPSVSAPINTILAPTMARLVEGRYLLANGSVLTKSGVTPPTTLKGYVAQNGAALVASPFGYLVVWTESDRLGDRIRGKRLAKDGTPLDAPSFSIHEEWPLYGVHAVYDSRDYVLTWVDWSTANVWIARISPDGAADLRVTQLLYERSGQDLKLVAHHGELFGFDSDFNYTIKDLHIYTIRADGQVVPQLLGHGSALGSDGVNLYSVGMTQNSEVRTILLQPTASGLIEVSTNVIASGSDVEAISLRDGLAVKWSDNISRWSWGYFQNGQQRFHSTTLLPTSPIFSQSEDNFLVAWRNGSMSNRWTFQAYDLHTGTLSEMQMNLGTVNALTFSSAAQDFMGVTSSIAAQIAYVGQFWLTSTPAPIFNALHLDNSQFKASMNLAPDRRYRIETSTDLLHWNVEQVVSGVRGLEIVSPSADQGFIRARLVPQ